MKRGKIAALLCALLLILSSCLFIQDSGQPPEGAYALYFAVNDSEGQAAGDAAVDFEYRVLPEGQELVPALGCTEPIAIAYAAARARRLLGSFPERMVVSCSGNIIKNVKGVIVPTTGNMRGIDTSALLGALAGDPDREMEVLRLMCKHMTNKEIAQELFISENTVKYHKMNMLGKTGFSKSVDLAFYMISNGWINPLY